MSDSIINDLKAVSEDLHDYLNGDTEAASYELAAPLE